MNMSDVVTGVVITKSCSVKADGETDESKTVHLRFTFDNVTLQSVFDKAVANAVIAWQTGARKKFDSLVDGSTITVAFKAPGRTSIDPVAYVIQQAAAMGMSVNEYLIAEAAKRGIPQLEQLK